MIVASDYVIQAGHDDFGNTWMDIASFATNPVGRRYAEQELKNVRAGGSGYKYRLILRQTNETEVLGV